jgi:adenylosuccinate synthase
MKHAVRINGVDQIALMKLDVLDGFDEVKVCVAYEVDGREIDYVPYDLEDATPVYKSFPGWEKTEGARKFDDLPETAKTYIEALEAMVGARMGIISTSPQREDTIIRGEAE